MTEMWVGGQHRDTGLRNSRAFYGVAGVVVVVVVVVVE
jgi:hypothetical protein